MQFSFPARTHCEDAQCFVFQAMSQALSAAFLLLHYFCSIYEDRYTAFQICPSQRDTFAIFQHWSLYIDHIYIYIYNKSL